MFIDVTLYAQGAVDAARRILDAWDREHDDYYGTPAGLSGRKYGYFGYREIPEGGRWLTSGQNYHALQIVRDRDGDEGVRVTFHGRRHGMRGEFARFLMTYWDASVEVAPNVRRERRLHAYVTQEPDWLPWETLDDHMAR